MNIDLPSMTAFALEGSALAGSLDHTLTLQLQGRGEWAGRSLGTVRCTAAREARAASLQAAVLANPAPALTLTF